VAQASADGIDSSDSACADAYGSLSNFTICALWLL
jgi:hypothetical protein